MKVVEQIPARPRSRYADMGLIILCVIAVVSTCFILFHERFEPSARLEVDSVVELGAWNRDEFCNATFTVRNAGTAKLVIAEALTSCNCQKIYCKRASGAEELVQNLEIESGETVTFGLRFLVSGELYAPTQLPITLTSNDPVRPAARVSLQYTPTARLFAIPAKLTYETLPLGGSATVSAELFADSRAKSIRPGELVTSRPAMFRARSVPCDESAGPEPLGNSRAAKVGQVEITLQAPQTPTTFDEQLILYQDGTEVLRIPVSMRCIPEFSIAPGVLRLPRASGAGPTYSGTLICTSRTREPFSVKLKSSSEDFAVEVLDPAGVSPRVFVTYTGDKDTRARTNGLIELLANRGKESAVLRFDVEVFPRSTAD